MLTQSAARCRGAAMVLRLFRDGNRLAASSSADDEVDASVTWQHHGLARPLRDDSAFADRARVPTMNMTEAATTRFQIPLCDGHSLADHVLRHARRRRQACPVEPDDDLGRLVERQTRRVCKREVEPAVAVEVSDGSGVKRAVLVAAAWREAPVAAASHDSESLVR